MGNREEIIEEIKISLENRNEYRIALGYPKLSIRWEVVSCKTTKELKETLKRFLRKEHYFKEYWRNQ